MVTNICLISIVSAVNRSYAVWRVICHSLAYANSSVNPFIYHAVSTDFRQTVREGLTFIVSTCRQLVDVDRLCRHDRRRSRRQQSAAVDVVPEDRQDDDDDQRRCLRGNDDDDDQDGGLRITVTTGAGSTVADPELADQDITRIRRKRLVELYRMNTKNNVCAAVESEETFVE